MTNEQQTHVRKQDKYVYRCVYLYEVQQGNQGMKEDLQMLEEVLVEVEYPLVELHMWLQLQVTPIQGGKDMFV